MSSELEQLRQQVSNEQRLRVLAEERVEREGKQREEQQYRHEERTGKDFWMPVILSFT